MISLTIHTKPIGWQRAGLGYNRNTGKPVFFTRSETRELQGIVQEEFRKQYPDHVPYDCPLTANITFYFQCNKKHKTGSPHIIKPDLDNLEKSILDALNQLAYRDDCLIYQCTKTKLYGETNYIEIQITPIQ